MSIGKEHPLPDPVPRKTFIDQADYPGDWVVRNKTTIFVYFPSREDAEDYYDRIQHALANPRIRL